MRRADVAHANRAGGTRFGEAYFRVPGLPERIGRGRQISLGRRWLCNPTPSRPTKMLSGRAEAARYHVEAEWIETGFTTSVTKAAPEQS